MAFVGPTPSQASYTFTVGQTVNQGGVGADPPSPVYSPYGIIYFSQLQTLGGASLPPGLTFIPSRGTTPDAAKGKIVGTPTTPGIWKYITVMSDATPRLITQNSNTITYALVSITITIVAAAPTPSPTPTPTPSGPQIFNYSWKVGDTVKTAPIAGVQNYIIWSGSMPPGLAILGLANPAGTGAVISGEPITPGTWSVVLYTAGTHTAVVQFNMTVTGTSLLQQAINAAANQMDWWHAAIACEAGLKVRRSTWVNQYIEFDGYLFWLVTFDPGTKAIIGRQVVQATDFKSTEFLATDWTIGGIAQQANVMGLTWWQASVLAIAGKPVRRTGWTDHFIDYDPASDLYFYQAYDATTEILGVRRVVQAPDFTDSEFNASDWTTEGIPNTAIPTIQIQIFFTGPVDDDVRVTVGGVVAYDPERNIGMYNPTQTAAYPPIILTAGKNGDVVLVDCFDGWPAGYVTSGWTAYVYSGGKLVQTVAHLVAAFHGVSSISQPSPVPTNYFNGLPPIKDYYPMGSFTIDVNAGS